MERLLPPSHEPWDRYPHHNPPTHRPRDARKSSQCCPSLHIVSCEIFAVPEAVQFSIPRRRGWPRQTPRPARRPGPSCLFRTSARHACIGKTHYKAGRRVVILASSCPSPRQRAVPNPNDSAICRWGSPVHLRCVVLGGEITTQCLLNCRKLLDSEQFFRKRLVECCLGSQQIRIWACLQVQCLMFIGRLNRVSHYSTSRLRLDKQGVLGPGESAARQRVIRRFLGQVQLAGRESEHQTVLFRQPLGALGFHDIKQGLQRVGQEESTSDPLPIRKLDHARR